ncbi:MAG: hypothetical protein CVV49_12775 [Spirochaetae bacterium HGW-Spirochaetae-5]|nr:MAG: hypothetical protein CVV49_12775 [Spirochaetae bacterium HGW-Spirochaetae-5]
MFRQLIFWINPYKNKKRIINLEGIVNRSVHKRNGWETGINITSMSKASKTEAEEVCNSIEHVQLTGLSEFF